LSIDHRKLTWTGYKIEVDSTGAEANRIYRTLADLPAPVDKVKTLTTISSETLQEIVDRLVEGLQPERIYLFGSQARGQAEPGSDVDLLLIVPDSDLPRHRREAFSYDLLWGLTVPVDLIVLTQAEFQRASQVKTSLTAKVQAEGKVLYGRG